jgi:hypothetical protein
MAAALARDVLDLVLFVVLTALFPVAASRV